MEIRFGITKTEKINEKKKVFENHVIEFPITMGQFENSHDLIRKTIYEKYPGWNLMGYCPRIYKEGE